MPKRSPEKTFTCRHCRKPITAEQIAAKHVTFTAAGPMHGRCEQDVRQDVNAIIHAAIAAGTHGKSSHFCGICRQWVDSIYHIGFDGTLMCPACADACGQGPKSWDRELIKRQQKYAPVRKDQPARVGKDAPHGRGAARDGRSFRPSVSPLSDEERRRRFPVSAPQEFDLEEVA